MNFARGGSAAGQANAAAMLQAAEFELDTMMGLYNAMTYTCHQKCINAKYADGEMNKGEGVCTDRCVAKFMEVFQQVGRKMQAQQQQQQQQ